MDPFVVSHFTDDALLHNLKLLNAHDCKTTAVMLTRIAEVEERKLFRREGYPSMHAYCVHELHFSEGMAYKRIQVARSARQFPAVLLAVAEGRLHLCAALMLTPHLRSGNVDELVAAAKHRTRFELERLLAEHSPKPDLPERLQAMPLACTRATASSADLAAEPIRTDSNSVTIPEQSSSALHALCSEPTGSGSNAAAQAPIEGPVSRDRVMPLSPRRYGYQFTFEQEAHDLFQDVRSLMGHEVRGGEVARVFESALELAKAALEKRKFAATSRPRRSGPSTSARHVPATVKRAVRERDGGRCTFVGDSGKRCPARGNLEFDHVEPVARGGQATVENLRLRCRAHNLYEAERTFGAEFMEQKRREAK